MSSALARTLFRNVRTRALRLPLSSNPVCAASFRFMNNGGSNIEHMDATKDDIAKMIKKDKVVVFMKGVPDAPRCGFSAAVCKVMTMHGAEFTSYDVLATPELRNAIKDFTSWPTIPQVFIDGEFIGGCDILLEKHQNGELIEDLLKVGIKSLILKEAQESNTQVSNDKN